MLIKVQLSILAMLAFEPEDIDFTEEQALGHHMQTQYRKVNLPTLLHASQAGD